MIKQSPDTNLLKGTKNLKKADRLRVLESMLLNEGHTPQQLSKIFGVTDRQIRRDLVDLRARWADAFRSLNIAGLMYGEMMRTLARMDQAMGVGDHQKVRSLALRWGVVESFTKMGASMKLDEVEALMSQLESQVTAMRVQGVTPENGDRFN